MNGLANPIAFVLMCFITVAMTGVSLPAVAVEDKPYTIVDGKVDFGTYNGFRRYHNTCHVCHGPDAMGSSFAPPLIDSLKTMNFGDFVRIVSAGQQNTWRAENSVMPGFAENPNVMKYINDIYAYLRARADGALGRGRPDRLPKGQ